MNEGLKQRCLNAINRATLYCLKVSNDCLTIVHLDSNKIAPVDEIYDVILYLRTMLPNKDEACKLRELVAGERSMLVFNSRAESLPPKTREAYARNAAKLELLLAKLEVLCGQA